MGTEFTWTQISWMAQHPAYALSVEFEGVRGLDEGTILRLKERARLNGRVANSLVVLARKPDAL